MKMAVWFLHGLSPLVVDGHLLTLFSHGLCARDPDVSSCVQTFSSRENTSQIRTHPHSLILTQSHL